MTTPGTGSDYWVLLHPGPSFDDYTLHLANALAPLLPTGLALDPRQRQRFAGALHPRLRIELYRRPRRRHVWGWAEMRSLARRARRRGARVLHVQGYGLWEWVLMRQSRDLFVVNTVHDPVNHLDYRTWLNDRLLAKTVQAAQAWVVHSPHMREVLLRHHPSVQRAKVCWHPHGPFTYYLRYRPPTAARQPYFLFFGEPRLNKGIDVLLRAWIQAQARLPRSWRLVLACNKPLPPAARRWLAAAQATERLEVHTRYLPDEEVARRFAEAGVVVLPYRHGTQSGVLALAAAFGAAVLATPVGTLPERVQHGRQVYFVPPADVAALAEGLIYLAHHADVRARLGQALREHALQAWSWETSARKLVACYRRWTGQQLSAAGS